jgi:LPS-assembly protein
LFFFHICFNLNAQELEINSTIVKYDNINKITIFEGNVNTVDAMGNKLFSNFAKYNQIEQLIKTQGDTKIETSGGYLVRSKDVIFDNKKKIIFSNKKTQIEDKDGNNISVEMFNYSISSNIFFSKGNIEIIDVNNNKYNFSEIYIDEKKKQIIGSDVKAFLKQDGFTADKNNEPRFFANTMTMSKETNILNKGIFTYCKNRPNGKCPPWTLQSKKIKHDLAKKTIYYDNVVLKVYDFPIFFSPKFSHPDPTVKRKSGFLVPSFVNSSSLGSGFSVPYFLNISDDKDLTFRPKLYLTEKPLLLAEYRQDFKNSFLIIDTGYTQGYKKQSTKKTSGGRAHMFANFNMSLIEEDEKNSNFEMNIEKVSNDTYLKIYDLETTLVKSDKSVLENTIDLTYQNKDFYFGFTPSLYEDMN